MAIPQFLNKDNDCMIAIIMTDPKAPDGECVIFPPTQAEESNQLIDFLNKFSEDTS